MSKNPAKSYSIFGSCVTRDVFGFSKESANVGVYIARSAICSALSMPLKQNFSIDSNSSGPLSPFELRMVKSDIEKTGLRSLADDESQSLIIDLVDERFSVIELQGSYVTESASLVRTPIYNALMNGGAKVHKFFDRDAIDRDCLQRFAAHLVSLGKRIYLHKAFWATKFRSGEDLVCFEKRDYHSRMNDALAWRYNFLEQLLPRAVVLDVPESLRVSDPSHRWGLAPFHYVQDYYEYVMNKVAGGEFY